MLNFSEEDLLNYLMTSDFNEGLSPDEFKFLLLKFRYNYRLTFMKNKTLLDQIDGMRNLISEKEKIFEQYRENHNKEKNDLIERLDKFKNRKLSWRERIKGKIILNKDEIK